MKRHPGADNPSPSSVVITEDILANCLTRTADAGVEYVIYASSERAARSFGTA